VLRTLLFLSVAPMDVLFSLLAVLWIIASRDPRDRVLLWLGLGMFAFFVLFVRATGVFYLVLWFSLAALALGRALRGISARVRSVSPQHAFAAMITVVCLALATNRFSYDLVPLRDYDHQRLLALVRAQVPAGATVLGQPTYWLGLQDHSYINWWAISYLWQRDHQSVRTSLGRYRPGVVIVDDYTRFEFSADPRPPALWEPFAGRDSAFWKPILDPLLHPDPMSESLDAALRGSYRLAYEAYVPGDGVIQVYRASDGA